MSKGREINVVFLHLIFVYSSSRELMIEHTSPLSFQKAKICINFLSVCIINQEKVPHELQYTHKIMAHEKYPHDK